jgi:uncharacterized protein (PEP-CTERM system associated)
LSALAIVACAVSPCASSQTWRITPTIALQETFTNNVSLSPDGQSDFVSQITPSLSFSEKGARTQLNGVVTVPISLYARTSANDQVYPSANIEGTAELWKDFFFINATANVSQQFFSPFGAQPNNFTNVTANRYRTETFSVNPYIAGTLAGGTRYEFRNNNVWTLYSQAPVETTDSYYVQYLADAENTQQRLGWRAHYEYTNVRFEGSGTQVRSTIRSQLARFVPTYLVDPQLRLEASVGFEDNDYTFTSSRDVIYGVGLEYRPTERMNIVAKYEHRFFGASYLVSFANRTPLTEWTLRASRYITTYPQQIAALPAGVNVAAFLNALFLSSIPDPAAREIAVRELMQSRGLPASLATPVDIYSQQVQLVQSESATVALIGARNTVLFTVYNSRSEQINATGSPVPPVLGFNNDNTQTGGSVVWSNKFTPTLLLTASADYYRSVSNNSQFPGTSRQGIAQMMVSMPLGARTTGFIGARYQAFSSDVAADYNEAAAWVGVAYTFR